MNLKKLYEPISFKWRVQSFSKFKAQGSCVAYIDARDAQKRLDEVCGQENWQALYYQVGNMLFCKVGIEIGEEWIWKSDTGSESNIEKEKGHSSDAFKRACVLWGIGRFLYDMKIQYVKANEKKDGNNYPYVVDNNGKRVWDLTSHINGKIGATTPAPNSFLDKMKNFAIAEPKIYKETLKFWQVDSAKSITNPDSQQQIIKEINDKIKGG